MSKDTNDQPDAINQDSARDSSNSTLSNISTGSQWGNDLSLDPQNNQTTLQDVENTNSNPEKDADETISTRDRSNANLSNGSTLSSDLQNNQTTLNEISADDKLKQDINNLATDFLTELHIGKSKAGVDNKPLQAGRDVRYFQDRIEWLTASQAITEEIKQTLDGQENNKDQKTIDFLSQQQKSIEKLQEKINGLNKFGKLSLDKSNEISEQFEEIYQEYIKALKQWLKDKYPEQTVQGPDVQSEQIDEQTAIDRIYQNIEDRAVAQALHIQDRQGIVHAYFNHGETKEPEHIVYQPVSPYEDLGPHVTGVNRVYSDISKEPISLYRTQNNNQTLKSIEASEEQIRDHNINLKLAIHGSGKKIHIQMKAGLTKIELPEGIREEGERLYIEDRGSKCYLPLDRKTVKMFLEAAKQSEMALASRGQEGEINPELKESAIKKTVAAIEQSQISAGIAKDVIQVQSAEKTKDKETEVKQTDQQQQQAGSAVEQAVPEQQAEPAVEQAKQTAQTVVQDVKIEVPQTEINKRAAAKITNRGRSKSEHKIIGAHTEEWARKESTQDKDQSKSQVR